eukprot:TRINITY_DN23184_c0_g1_i1.p2 TRINITY_DN23184_c0_g1~~TRINITY_DN23184_c0_g1_i1.p2  ORF type:complete len:254 (+),score=4.49 TRINITY_DN23184_c0_g1_i1:270-1031(+)
MIYDGKMSYLLLRVWSFEFRISGRVITQQIPYYDSYGSNQLFYEEGQNINTVSGKEAMVGVSSDQCATICHWMDRQCGCCNSFSYQPWSGKCYLKKRNQFASNAHSYNSNGWQSYKYWGQGYQYSGGLPNYAQGRDVRNRVGVGYSSSFVSKGPNQLARYEGYTVTQATYMSVKQCAEMCLRYNCDGFSYNPNQEGGKCYLKNNSAAGKYNAVYSSEGWTFYWLEKNIDKCYCTCASEFVCVTCRSGGACDDY